jgi:hypothetical protein
MNVPSFGIDAPAAAICPEHPNQPSVATCARCGRFLCAACVAVPQPPTCHACAARSRDALGLGTRGLTVSNALWLAAKLMSATVPVLLTVMVLGGIAGGLFDLVTEDWRPSASRLADRVYSLSIGLVLNIAIVAAMVRASEGQALGPGAALAEGFNKFGRVLVAQIRQGFWILGYALLLIVPGILKALSFTFVTLLAWKSAEDPLPASEALTVGRRGTLFGLLFIAFIGFFLVLFSASVVSNLVTEAQPALRVPAAMMTNVFMGLGERFLDATIVAAYLLRSNELNLAAPSASRSTGSQSFQR